MAEPLRVDGVSKVYPGGNLALDDVSLDITPSTFLVLLGPSGSGKTTLLRSLAGIERITAGSISIGNVVVAGPRTHLPPERRDLSMVFQDYALWPHMTATGNVAFAMRRRGLPKDERIARARAMLDRVGLGALVDRYPGELSGGEQQRVALARALVADTGLLLCDEPLSNLDADLRERMQTEISTLVRSAGATTIYITHDQSEAFALADQVGVLDKGRLVQFGSPEEIYRSPANSFVARFTGLSGEFPVRVEGAATSPGRILVVADLEGAQGAIEVTAGAGAPSKGPAVLLVRRSAVTLRSPDDGSVHLRGSVEDVAYRGRNYEVTIDLGGGCRLGGVQCDDRMPRGTSVGLQLDPQGCMVFDNEPAPADAGESGGGAERTDVRVQRLEATEAAVGYSTM